MQQCSSAAVQQCQNNFQLRLEYFIAAAIAIIIILILVLVIVAVLLIRVCRNRSGSNGSSSGSSFSDPATKSASNKLGSVISLNVSNGHGSKIAPALSAKMPKHIQVTLSSLTSVKHCYL